MKKEAKNIYFYLLALLIAFILSLQFDFLISKYIESMRGSFLNSVMLIFTSFLWQVILLAGASIIVYVNNKKKLLHLWLAAALTLALSAVIKVIVARPRPFEEGISALSSLIKDSYTTWNLSFPSNHAAFAFAMLPFLPKKWQWPWFIISVMVAFSRVYFGLHYLSDVIAGACLGFGVSYLVRGKA